MEVIRFSQENNITLPVSGEGSAIVVGALLKRNPITTAATTNGHISIGTGNNAQPDAIGVLKEAHATANDTDVAGTIFTLHPVDLIVPMRIVRMAYSTAAADLITPTQAVTTTTITLTSLEDDIDAGFLYVVSGAGAGQINYLTASAAGSATLKAAFATNLDTTSRLIKILPRFHQFASLNADGTKLSSQRAVGLWTVAIMETWMIRGETRERLNPVAHSTLTGLNNNVIRFEQDVAIRDTFPYTID